MTNPTEGLIPATPRRNGDTLSMLLIGLIIFGGWVAYEMVMAGVTILETVSTSRLPQRLGLPKEQVGQALITCYNDAGCKAWLEAAFWQLFPKWHLGLLALIPAPAIAVAFRKDKKKYDQKAPGSATWATMKDVPQLAPEADQVAQGNPHTGYLGSLMEFKPGKKEATLKPLLVPLNEWCQNVLVIGGVGSGKTTGFFQNYGMMAAHLGHTVIVVDTKWPQRDSGLRELIGYWHALGRHVVLYSPFEDQGVKMDMAGDLASFDAALRYSDTVMPPPEFRDEPGEHFKKLERRVLAAMAQANAMGGGTQEDLLNHAMDTPADLKKWMSGFNDRLLQRVLEGAMSRGDKDFADSMTGIISALRVFYNKNVVRATTPGQPQETIDLEACFKQPTLIYFAVNQEDMLDGSGTVLLRLFLRRITEAIFRVSRTTPTGKLPHPATIAMDEQPSYGRMNYLMRLTGTMRSYNLSILFGIQNSAQGKLVYGSEYWEAISENVISRRIAFPRGLTGPEAEDISQRIGFTTNLGVSIGVQSGQNGDQDRLSATTRLERTPLLPIEEFSSFEIGEGVVLSSQHPPIRALFTPITFKEVKNPRVKAGTSNWLHEMFFQDMARRLPPNMSLSAYTDSLIAAGKFRTLPKPLQLRSKEIAPGVYTGAGQEAMENAFKGWVQLCLDEHVEVKLIQNGVDITQFELLEASLREHPDLFESVPAYVNAAFLTPTKAGLGFKLTANARTVLGAEMMEEVALESCISPIMKFMRERGAYLEGHPHREAIPEEKRDPAIGNVLTSGILEVNLAQLKIMFNKSQPQFAKRRVGTVQLAQIPYGDPRRVREIVDQSNASGDAQGSIPQAPGSVGTAHPDNPYRGADQA